MSSPLLQALSAAGHSRLLVCLESISLIARADRRGLALVRSVTLPVLLFSGVSLHEQASVSRGHKFTAYVSCAVLCLRRSRRLPARSVRPGRPLRALKADYLFSEAKDPYDGKPAAKLGKPASTDDKDQKADGNDFVFLERCAQLLMNPLYAVTQLAKQQEAMRALSLLLQANPPLGMELLQHAGPPMASLPEALQQSITTAVRKAQDRKEKEESERRQAVRAAAEAEAKKEGKELPAESRQALDEAEAKRQVSC